jgi:hypothetical protein
MNRGKSSPCLTIQTVTSIAGRPDGGFSLASLRFFLVPRIVATWVLARWLEASSGLGRETVGVAAQGRISIPPRWIGLSNALDLGLAPGAHVTCPLAARVYIEESIRDVRTFEDANLVWRAGKLTCCPPEGRISTNSRHTDQHTPGSAGSRDRQHEETGDSAFSGVEMHWASLASRCGHVNGRSRSPRRDPTAGASASRALP